jgi:hypothetical protein
VFEPKRRRGDEDGVEGVGTSRILLEIQRVSLSLEKLSSQVSKMIVLVAATGIVGSPGIFKEIVEYVNVLDGDGIGEGESPVTTVRKEVGNEKGGY